MAFKILSLDGGGIRGAFTASFLATLEDKLDRPLGDYFDLLAGTSTGGIIASAIALNMPAADIVEFYRTWGPKIFTRAKNPRPGKLKTLCLWVASKHEMLRTHGIDADYIMGPRYNSDVLKEGLEKVFTNNRVKDCNHRLIVPAVDLVKGATVVFRTPHLPDLFRDPPLLVSAITLATTAAPTYFQPVTISPGSAYADGGLWANNPAMVAYTEAVIIDKRCQRECDLHFDRDEIEILSVGTGRLPYFIYPNGKPVGLASWMPDVIEIMGSSQAQGIALQAGFLTAGGQYQRIDFDLPNRNWGLDCITQLNPLIHKGREKAFEMSGLIRSSFLREPASMFQPYLT